MGRYTFADRVKDWLLHPLQMAQLRISVRYCIRHGLVMIEQERGIPEQHQAYT